MNYKNDEKIDFVILWVDGSDFAWKRKFKKYAPKVFSFPSESDSRFRDYGLLKYWFRSVEKYAPWVNHIYMVTDDQVPDFINLSNPKISIIDHKDIIPEKYLPTFNSNVIEFYIHKIPNLSEHFVLFNDDMYLNQPTKPSDFFYRGLPRDFAVFKPLVLETWFDHIQASNLIYINSKYGKKKHELVLRNFFKFFNIKYGVYLLYSFYSIPYNNFLGFQYRHVTIAFNKTQYQDFVSNFKGLASQSLHRVRDGSDISQWAIRYSRLINGKFYPQSPNFGTYFVISDVDSIRKEIFKSKHHVICINDQDDIKDIDLYRKNLYKIFNKIYNLKSSFEI
ncbi:hypothetical protein X284_08720 [Oenococcus oeni IOEB_8417]|uniref:stealth family protein n=1 Tax=Oenococcus oeni TaxID=1247 RepID=UPI00050FBC24|nr:stealth family protein [Oenococcus oeni]KGH58623.1 hypothetical protein X288_06850 [Oenococcus oeni IOEB_9805]KGH75227.1 hypothetical protein X287_07420 [Oenococcus oeni IOEB_9803]KGH77191.1 hypothetical protein X284_08720 [Oenococcus oeni IOEB_8417]